MTTSQLAINLAETTLLVLVVAGIGARRRASDCWFFLAYLLVVIVVHTSMAIWQEQFFVFTVYVVTETVTVVLKFAVGLEIWWKSFSRMPRARARVGGLLAGVLLGVALAIRVTPPELDSYDSFLGIVNPRQQAGTLTFYAAIIAGLAWHRSPILPMHRAILGGFAVYLSIYTFALSYVLWPGAPLYARQPGLMLVGVSYGSAILWWAWAAWRPIRAPNPVVARLYPWARSW